MRNKPDSNRKMGTVAAIVLGLTTSFAFVGESLANTITLFEDDFNDSVLDSSKWTPWVATGSYTPPGAVGSYVEETSGMLRVVQNQTDWGGAVISSPIILDNSTGLITLTMRTRTHRENQYYRGSISISQLPTGSPGGAIPESISESLTGVAHMDYDDGSLRQQGFGDGGSMASGGSAFFTAIFDEWVTETLVYDPLTQRTTYSLNGATPIEYDYWIFPLTKTTLDLWISSYGWFTGH